MRLKVAVVAVIAVIALAGGVMYYVSGTPHYSLYLLRRAVREGDRDAFYEHFDVRRVIENTVSRTVGGIRAGPNLMAREATEIMLPAAERVITERIDERLADPAAAPIMDMSVDSVRYQGRAAYVTLRHAADGSTTTIVLEQKRDRKWKVVDLDLSKARVLFQLSDMM
jgi:hypothetical protein